MRIPSKPQWKYEPYGTSNTIEVVYLHHRAGTMDDSYSVEFRGARLARNWGELGGVPAGTFGVSGRYWPNLAEFSGLSACPHLSAFLPHAPQHGKRINDPEVTFANLVL